MPSESWIGVVIACSGNILISVALNCQKLAHKRLESQSLNPTPTATPGSRSPNPNTHISPYSSTPSSPSKDRARPNPLSPASRFMPLPTIASIETGESGHLTPVEVIPVTVGPEIVVRGASPSAPDTIEPSLAGTDYFGSAETLKDSIIDLSLSASNPKTKRRSITFDQLPTHDLSDDPPANGYNGLGRDASGATDDEEEAEPERVFYMRSKLWWLGILLMSIGEGGNFLSYGFAPASVVAPLGTVALIANCFLSPLMLGERFHWKDLLGVLLAIIGAITVVLSSKSSNIELDPKSLLIAVKQTVFLVYTGINIALVAALLAVTHSKRWGGRWIGIDVGICALFGGYTVLSTKALSSVLPRLFLKSFRYPITWALLAVLVGTSVLQIKYLNRAMMRWESKEVVPTQFVFFSMAAIVGSAVLYQEFRDVTFSRVVNFLFGIATTFLGVFILTATFPLSSPSPPVSPSPPAEILSTSRSALIRTQSHHLSPLLEDSPLLRTASRSSYTASRPIKLRHRNSTTSLTGHRPGLASQGFLLIATTPPQGGSGTGSLGRGVRSRSASRSGGMVGSLGEEREDLERGAGHSRSYRH